MGVLRALHKRMLSPGNRVDSNASDLDAHGLVHINASEYFPKKACIADDPDLSFPFPVISGEYVEFLGRTAEDGIMALSNYRIFIQYPQSYVNLPVRMIEQADIQNYTNSIVLTCKNGTTIRCSFLSADKTIEWQKRISNAINAPKKLEDLFAFTFYAWKSEERSGCKPNADTKCFNSLSSAGYAFDISREAKRMKFDLDTRWRISEINVKYEVSPTYPKFHIVPSCVADADLSRIAEFRSSRRFPSIVWRHRKNGSVIARSSQPELGFFGWRCSQDENLLQAITTACFEEKSTSVVGQSTSNGHIPNGDSPTLTMPKLLILDARSYAAAVANRAKGGGSEYAEYYPNCEIQYMSMANIHTVRKSFFLLRQLCTSPADRVDFMSALDKSLWLHHISAIIKTTSVVTSALDVEGRPVLVHCSDGWDRTTQIVALAMLMMDAHYRTIRGFQTLIEWQWLEFGHKFADRCGHGASNDETERCPIFLQWLDCVYQLVLQFPVEFEFNEAYLIHLAHHAYSCFFGTFLCNTSKEREKNTVNDRTYSLWSYLEREADECFYNILYAKREMVLRPDYSVRNLIFWGNLYITECNPLSANVHPPEVICVGTDPKIGNPNLPRTRSVENLSNNVLSNLQTTENHLHRASSESNILSNGTTAENGISDSVAPIIGSPSTNVATSPNSHNSEFIPLRLLHKSASLPSEDVLLGANGIVDDDSDDHNDDSPNASQSAPHISTRSTVVNSLETSKTSSDGTMERSTDTITGDDNIQTLLLERYPSTQDVHTEDDDSKTESSSVEDGGIVNGKAVIKRYGSPHMDCSINTNRKTDIWAMGQMMIDSGSNRPISESLMASAMFSDANSLQNAGGTSIPKRMDSKSFLSPNVTPTPLKMVEINHHSSPVSSPTRPRRTSRHLQSASSSDSIHSDMNDSFHEHNLAIVRRQLGPDGLAILHDERQIRLRQIRDAYQKEVDTLRRELLSIKSSLRSRNGYANGTSGNHRHDSCSEEALNSMDIPGHGPDTVDYGTSYGSDVSWDNIDDKEAQTTPWVPDHCVTNCRNCGSRFWLGKRKHHCRNCGLVFCSNCSDNQIPLPHDRVYYPVRVCRNCYLEVQKQHNGLKALVNRRHAGSQQPTHA